MTKTTKAIARKMTAVKKHQKAASAGGTPRRMTKTLVTLAKMPPIAWPLKTIPMYSFGNFPAKPSSPPEIRKNS